jgi:hypothetical protein
MGSTSSRPQILILVHDRTQFLLHSDTLTLENTQLQPASREMTYEYDLEYTLIVLLL